MDQKIRGITVTINGDTTGLGKALDTVKKQSIGLNRELKSVNKALNFNPSSASLLTEKQKAGPEAVLPLHSFYSELRNIIAELVDRNAGPTEFNQYNSYYSPKDLSPAECARKTRDETRQLLKNVKRA